jgi:hypothetical protein
VTRLVRAFDLLPGRAVNAVPRPLCTSERDLSGAERGQEIKLGHDLGNDGGTFSAGRDWALSLEASFRSRREQQRAPSSCFSFSPSGQTSS